MVIELSRGESRPIRPRPGAGGDHRDLVCPVCTGRRHHGWPVFLCLFIESLSLKAVWQLCFQMLVSRRCPHMGVWAAFPRWRAPLAARRPLKVPRVRGLPSAVPCELFQSRNSRRGTAVPQKPFPGTNTQLGLLARGQVWDDVGLVVPSLTSLKSGGKCLVSTSTGQVSLSLAVQSWGRKGALPLPTPEGRLLWQFEGSSGI